MAKKSGTKREVKKVTAQQIKDYERDHPFPTYPTTTTLEDGTEKGISGSTAKEFSRAAFQWMMNHPRLATTQGVKFATAQLSFWDQATPEECDKLGTFFPGS